MVQNLQIILGAAPFLPAVAEAVVGQAKARRREQIVAVSVMRERTGFADQRVDHVPIVHRRTIPTDQSRQRVDVLVGVPDFHAVGEQPGFDLFTDQAAMHGIDVAVDVNQAAAVHATRHLQTRRQPLIGQVLERRQLLGEAVTATRVANLHQVVQEIHILRPAGEIATATQQQRLIDGGFEVPMRRFRVAVLVRLPRVDALARHAVMGQQIAIARLELACRRQVVHGGTQAVATVPPWHAAEFPERILQTVGQGFERLGGTERHRLPVRIGQHEVVHQVVEHLAAKKIPLEICLSSNLRTGAVKSLAEHPVRRLYDAGVPIILNTDDPAMFDCTLTSEYQLAAREFGFTEEELAGIAENSLRYAFQ